MKGIKFKGAHGQMGSSNRLLRGEFETHRDIDETLISLDLNSKLMAGFSFVMGDYFVIIFVYSALFFIQFHPLLALVSIMTWMRKCLISFSVEMNFLGEVIICFLLLRGKNALFH